MLYSNLFKPTWVLQFKIIIPYNVADESGIALLVRVELSLDIVADTKIKMC